MISVPRKKFGQSLKVGQRKRVTRSKSQNSLKGYTRKATEFWLPLMMLKISQTEEKAHLEAWIRASLFVRLRALFIIPSEIGIESVGLRGVAPCRIARKAVNKLLERLEQSLIP